MQIKPLYFDPGTNQITESSPGDTLAFPVTAVVIEYVTLFQNTDINTCCALISETAIPVTSNNLPNFNYRKEPYVDCVILEAGLAGQTVQAALTHGKNYQLTNGIQLVTNDILYLGQDGKLTLTQPSVINGDRWLVEVGRLANANEFIFDPKTPIDFTVVPGGGGNVPSPIGYPKTWLFTDGTNLLWKKITAADILPIFTIQGFSPVSSTLELGQTISNPTFNASYNEIPASVQINNSISATWTIISSPFTSFSSPGSFLLSSQGSIDFNLEAFSSDGTSQITTTSIGWYSRKFWGTGILGTAIDQLQNSQLSASRGQTFTITANINEYVFLAIPSSFGTPTFTVGGFSGGFHIISSNLNYTNIYGITIPYDIWQSDNTNLGQITIVVS